MRRLYSQALTVVLALTVYSTFALAQRIPLCIVVAAHEDDDGANRLKKVLEDDIKLSDKFVLWLGAPFDVPKNGLNLYLWSQPHYEGSGGYRGSSITLNAMQPSKTERTYFREIYTEQWYVKSGEQVSDDAHGFLAALLGKMKGKARQQF